MDLKELLVVFFYNQIKSFVERFAGTLGIPVDYLLLAIGYWKRDTWWGRGLMYGAVASIGREMGAQIVKGIPGVAPATTSTTAISAPGRRYKY
jgi:hypothetical protein